MVTHCLEREGLTPQPSGSDSPSSSSCLSEAVSFGTGDRSPEQSGLGHEGCLLVDEVSWGLGMCVPLGHLLCFAPLLLAR